MKSTTQCDSFQTTEKVYRTSQELKFMLTMNTNHCDINIRGEMLGSHPLALSFNTPNHN
jgi:hypothetical protein